MCLCNDDQLFAFVLGALSSDEFFGVLGKALLTRNRVDDANRFGQGVSSTWLENPRYSGLPVVHASVFNSSITHASLLGDLMGGCQDNSGYDMQKGATTRYHALQQ